MDRFRDYRNLMPHNVDAMMIAELQQLPTINGFASFNPPGWNFGDPEWANYPGRVHNYARPYHLSGICGLDLKARHWFIARE